MNRPDLLERYAVAFTRASALDGYRETWFDFAGHPVRLRTVGDELGTRTVAPFSHLEREPAAEPRLTIDLWDERATGQPLPPTSPVGPGDPAVYGDPRAPGVVWRVSEDSVRLLDRESCRIVGWCRDAAALPPEERAKPLRHLLDTWYLDRCVPVIHSAAVAADRKGALIVGPSGAGKSTTALACASAGMELLGDDQVGLESLSDREFRAHSLYSAARLEPQHLAEHPWLACGETAVAQAGDKSLVFAGRASAVRWARSAPVTVILLPTRTGAPGLHPASGSAALHALAPSTLIGLMAGGRWTLERLTRLTASTPCFFLHTGLGPAALSGLVREALAQAG